MGFIKTKNFRLCERPYQEDKKMSQGLVKNIYKPQICTGVISRLYKEFSELNCLKKKKNLVRKRGKDEERHFTEEDLQDGK